MNILQKSRKVLIICGLVVTGCYLEPTVAFEQSCFYTKHRYSSKIRILFFLGDFSCHLENRSHHLGTPTGQSRSYLFDYLLIEKYLFDLVFLNPEPTLSRIASESRTYYPDCLIKADTGMPE